jgi:serine/threonine protein kinase
MIPTELEPGTTLMGRYTLQRRLGRGYGGETWLAEGPSGSMAIKILSAQDDPEGRRQADLLREATLLRGFDHPHVVGYRGIHDLAEEGWTLLVTDFVEGGDLEALVLARRAPYSPDEVARLGLQLVLAVQALHEHHCLHRDLKPSNVLVTQEQSDLPLLRIADFGISRPMVGGRARPSQPLGSLGYASPEQFGTSELTAASDRYALGGILLFLATGHHPPPITAQHRCGMIEALVLRAQGSEDGEAHRLGSLIEGLMAPQPEDRPDLDRCQQVLEALEAGRELPPTPAEPPAAAAPAAGQDHATMALDQLPPALQDHPPAPDDEPTPPVPAPARTPKLHLRRAGPIIPLLLVLGVAAAWATVRPFQRWGDETIQHPTPSPDPEPDIPEPIDEVLLTEGEPIATPDPLPDPQHEHEHEHEHEHDPQPEPEPTPVPEPTSTEPEALPSTLVINSRPTGAKATVDGASAGATPRELTIPPKGALITLDLDGYEPLHARCPGSLPSGTLLCWDFRVAGPCRRSVMSCEPIQ